MAGFLRPVTRILCSPWLLLGVVSAASAQTTGQSTLSVTVGPEASIAITNSTTTLAAGSTFADYTGTTAFTYKVRTSASTGAGNIQLEVTSDFSPANGPSVASPPTSGDRLAYTCTLASPATACSGAVAASTSSQTSVATFGADTHTGSSGSNGSVSWTLSNDASYRPGTYSATVTFTISAT